MNQELKAIFKADQGDRSPKNLKRKDWIKLAAQNDDERMKMVKEMLKKGLVKTKEDYYHAAMIFQHGENTAEYKKANQLAAKSMRLGYKPAKWLYAASLDRWLLHKGNKYQKFGTQFERKNIKSPWKLCPVNPRTTDEERAKYDVPSLRKQREREKALNKRGY